MQVDTGPGIASAYAGVIQEEEDDMDIDKSEIEYPEIHIRREIAKALGENNFRFDWHNYANAWEELHRLEAERVKA